jgi:hypothetical protein
MDILLGAQPQHRIEPGIQPVARRLSIQRHDIGALRIRTAAQHGVQRGGKRGGRAGQPMLVIAQQIDITRQHGLLQNGAAEGRAGQAPLPGQPIQHGVQHVLHRRGVSGGVDAGEQMRRVKRKQHGIRLERMQG